MRRGVTLADVAAEAGLSRSTASLVFRNDPVVSGKARRRVLEAAEALGYVYNRHAARLRTSATKTIGILTPGPTNPFFGGFVEALEHSLDGAGYTALLANTSDSTAREAELVRTFMEYRVDGALIVPAAGSPAEFGEVLSKLEIPHVILTRRLAAGSDHYVGSDDLLGGRLAAAHLVDHGCRAVAYLGGPLEVFTHVDRSSGARRRLEESGVAFDSAWSGYCETSSAAGFDLARRLLRAGPPPDGIICHSDAIALGVMRAFQDAGIAVGSDVRVVGFDDVPNARYWWPSLTTVRIEIDVIAQAAVDMLLGLISGEGTGTQPVLVEPELIVRESCGCSIA